MKVGKFALTTLLCIGLSIVASAQATWNYPQNGSTVGNPTYFDCTAPVTPNYMKLWISGASSAIWTVHATNRLVFVNNLAPGTYTMNCQYNDGTTHNSLITITVGSNFYDGTGDYPKGTNQAGLDDDPYNNGNDYDWIPQVQPLGGQITYDSRLDTSTSTDGQSRWFSGTWASGGGDYSAIYFNEKRCASVFPKAGIGKRAGHFLVFFDALADTPTPRAFEFGLTVWFNSTRYRMAFQPNYFDTDTSGKHHWRVFDPADGTWHQSNVTLDSGSAQDAPVPVAGFKRIYLVGHPYTDSQSHERVAFDAVQIGQCASTPCSDQDSDPIHPVAVTQVDTEPSNSVATTSGGCYSGNDEGNAESQQIDVDDTGTGSPRKYGKIWTDQYQVHLQP